MLRQCLVLVMLGLLIVTVLPGDAIADGDGPTYSTGGYCVQTNPQTFPPVDVYACPS